MSKRLLVLVAVAAVALALVYWLAQGFGTSVEGRSRPETAPAEKEEKPAPAPTRTNLESPLGLTEEAEPATALPSSTESTEAPAESSARRKAASLYEEELAKGRWVEGRVIFPEGTPVDEKAFILAKGRDFEHGPEHKVEVARDGSFRVAFSEKTKKGRLLLEARHLYLEKNSSFDVRDPVVPLVLEPRLGVLILGKLVLPEDGSIAEQDLSEASLQLHGDFNRKQETFFRNAKVEALAFEFAGLPADDTYSISLECQMAYARNVDGIQVEPGETRTLEIEVRRGVVIEGRVVDESGAPLSKVNVNANSQSQALDLTDWSLFTTAEDGTFRLQGLGPGEVTLHAMAQGFENFERELGALEEGEHLQGLELVLKRGFKIAGRVLWPDGTPADASVGVQIENPGRVGMHFFWNSNFQTEEDGTFEASGLVEGKYRVEARGVHTAEVKEPSPLTGKERTKKKRTTWRASAEHVEPGTSGLVLTLDPGLALYGTVKDDLGTPVDDFRIEARPEENGTFFGGVFPDDGIQRSFKDTGGSFELTGFSPGVWNVVAKAKGYGDSAPNEIAVPDDLANEVQLMLPRAARIEGLVLDPGGRPVARAGIVVSEGGDQRVYWNGSDTSSARADEGGSFVLEKVAPGAIQLHATSDLAAPSDKLELELAPGETRTGIELRLRTGGRITGKVVDANGRGEADHALRLHNWDFGLNESTSSGAAGEFVFENLPAGRYRLTAAPTATEISSIFGSSTNGNADALLERQLDLELAEGEAQHVVLSPPALKPVHLSGIVTIDGEPFGGVHLRASGGPEVRGNQTQTNQDGSYELTLPSPGTFQVNLWGRETQYSTQVEVPQASEFTFDIAFATGRISGRVRGPRGEPLAGIEIRAQLEAEHPGRWSSTSGTTASDSEGDYEITVPTGTYTIKAGHRGWDDPTPSSLAPASIESIAVTAGSHVKGIDLVLQQGGTIEGIVRKADGSALPAGVEVHVQDATDGWTQAEVDAAGRFHVEGVPPGQVYVTAEADGLTTREVVTFELRRDSIEEVVLELVPGTMTTARVVDATGAPISEGVEVVLVDPDGSEEPAGLWEELWWLGMLPPGEYKVRATWLGKTVEVAFELSGEAEREIEVRVE